MSALSIVQQAALRLGISSPTAVATSVDPQVLQLLALLNAEGISLAAATNWQALTIETSFVTVATEIQGSMATIAPGCKFVINDTIWNRDLRRPVFGPLAPQIWQQQKAMFMQGPWNQYRIVDGDIKFVPVPAAGQDCYFEYVTTNWAVSSGGTGQSMFLADSDTTLLDEEAMTLGLIWRWKQMKGFDFEIDGRAYDQYVKNLIGRDAAKPVLNSGMVAYDIYPGVYVPAGSWGT